MIEATKWSKIIPHELASTTANRAYLAFIRNILTSFAFRGSLIDYDVRQKR